MSRSRTRPADHASDCPDCPFSRDRRDFLRAAAIAAGVAAITAATGAAEPLPVRFVRAVTRTGGMVTYPFPDADGVTVDAENKVLLARANKRIYAFSMACPHQGTVGIEWLADEERFQCPKHKSRYFPDGRFKEGRATRGLDRHPITRKGKEQVEVNTDVLVREDEDVMAWVKAVIDLSGR